MKRLFGILLLALPCAAHAQWAVFDASNVAQTTMTAINTGRAAATQTSQYLAQVSQYKTQLDSYLQQMKDAMGLTEAMKVYNDAMETIGELQALQGQFQNAADLQSYLNQFHDASYWARSNPSVYASYNYAYGPDVEKRMNDNWVKSLDAQQRSLAKDAQNLERQQTAAADAQGYMQAMQTQTQVGVNTGKQLMAIRSLMIAQQQAAAVKAETDANRLAMQRAASDKFFQFTPPTSSQGFTPLP